MSDSKTFSVTAFIKNWYNGRTTITEFEGAPEHGIFIFPLVSREYHWTARAARKLVRPFRVFSLMR